MLTIHPEFVVDNDQKKKAVIIPLHEWEKILDDMEELEDIRSYDKIKKNKSDPIPFSKAVSAITKTE